MLQTCLAIYASSFILNIHVYINQHMICLFIQSPPKYWDLGIFLGPFSILWTSLIKIHPVVVAETSYWENSRTLQPPTGWKRKWGSITILLFNPWNLSDCFSYKLFSSKIWSNVMSLVLSYDTKLDDAGGLSADWSHLGLQAVKNGSYAPSASPFPQLESILCNVCFGFSFNRIFLL